MIPARNRFHDDGVQQLELCSNVWWIPAVASKGFHPQVFSNFVRSRFVREPNLILSDGDWNVRIWGSSCTNPSAVGEGDRSKAMGGLGFEQSSLLN